MAKVLTETDVTDREPEYEKVRQWRFEWLYHSGFSIENAHRLASTSVDLHFACNAIKNAKMKGFDEEYVLKLLV